MPFFSIIIPLYNKDMHIYDTLNSVLNQTFTDYEIIIVNDGSTDNSLTEVKKIIDNRLVIYDQENKGVSQARNFAMQNATGDYFAFLDADDIWKPNHLQNLNKLIIEFPNCGMYCANYIFDYGDNYTVNPKFPTLPIATNWSGIVHDFFNASITFRIALTSAVAVPQEVTHTIGLFSPKITSGQDTDFWTRIALEKDVCFTKQQSVLYNTCASNRITNKSILNKNLTTFEQFLDAEKSNLSLKKFNDMYRSEYAIHYKIVGDLDSFNFYKKGINFKSISIKNKILLHLPRPFLIALWHWKQWGKAFKKGLAYNF